MERRSPHPPAMMGRAVRSGLALLAALLVPSPPLSAQGLFTPALTFGAQSSSVGPGLSAVTAEPTMWFQSGRSQFWMRGATELGGLNSWLRDGDIVASSRVAQLGSARLSLEAAGEITRPQHTPDQFMRTRLELRAGSSSAAQGYAAGVGLFRNSTPTGGSTSTMASVNTWIRRLGVGVTGQVVLSSIAGQSTSGGASSNPFTPQGGDTLLQRNPGLGLTAPAAQRLFFSTDARMGVACQLGEMDLDGTFGTFLFAGVGARPYGVMTLTHWVAPNAAITAGLVRRVLDPIQGSATTGAMFGVRFAYRGRTPLPSVHDIPPVAASRLESRRVGDSVFVEVRAPGASRVELQGDPTRWLPRDLQHAPNGSWRIAFALKPGVYRMNLRVDEGAWAPPPGAARATDAYEGVVGVVVLE